jgi:hypothetical protein
MKVTKLYLDMDGVLCNFEKRFTELYGKDALGARDRKNFTTNWPNFIMDGNFESLEWFPGGKELLDFIQNETDWEVEILSSSGGEKLRERFIEVSEDSSIIRFLRMRLDIILYPLK